MKAKKLPKKFFKFFWDINAAKLDTARYPEYVIERLLNLGDLKAVKWLWETFNREKIIEVIKTSRQINPKTANFFTKFLNLNPKEVFCLQRASQNRSGTIWPY